MSRKTGRSCVYIWKLILFILFAVALLSAVVVAVAQRLPEMAGGLVGEAILVALLGLWWWQSWRADRVLMARDPEKQRRLLQKVTDGKQLLRIARASESPLREAALDRVDPALLLEAARDMDEFAIRRIRDPEQLFRIATEQDFFHRPKKRQVAGYQQRMDRARDLAVECIADADVLRRVAKADGLSVAWTALRKLLKDHPELARDLVGDWTLPQPKRDYAVKFLTEQVEQRIESEPGAAMDLFRDRTLPPKARLAALNHVSDQADLYALYDLDDDNDLRKAVVKRITDEAALTEIIEREPNKGIRLNAENRVTDPEKRKLYCERDGAHLWKRADSWWEAYGDWHYEHIRYRCVYCGHEYVDEGESRKD